MVFIETNNKAKVIIIYYELAMVQSHSNKLTMEFTHALRSSFQVSAPETPADERDNAIKARRMTD